MQLAPHFSAKTDISSIGPVDAEYSQVFSALRLFEITPHLFLNLSIAQLRNGELFETAIEDKNIVDETESPFYLRGYEAIEKEIALIASRTDKTPIIANLVTLKRQRRKIAQDNTIEQALAHFQLTPVVTGEQFVAMSMGIAKTEFTYL